MGALTLGNEALRLRLWLETEPLTPELQAAVGKTLERWANFCEEPMRAYHEVKREIARLAPRDPGPGQPSRRMWARVLGALEEMEVYLGKHPRLLKLAPIT